MKNLKKEPNIIDNWLEKNGDQEINKQVEIEAEELIKQEILEEVAEIILFENTKNVEIRYKGNRDMVIKSMLDIAKWRQEQILDFLYSEITERRDYSASKMCEKVIEFIEQFKNK